MRTILTACLIFSAASSTAFATHVRGYYRKDGTYVHAYERGGSGGGSHGASYSGGNYFVAPVAPRKSYKDTPRGQARTAMRVDVHVVSDEDRRIAAERKEEAERQRLAGLAKLELAEKQAEADELAKSVAKEREQKARAALELARRFRGTLRKTWLEKVVTNWAGTTAAQEAQDEIREMAGAK